MIYIWLVIAVCAASALTALLHRYALAHSLIDTPNERSSHVVATPRGGGVAIVCVFLLFLLGWHWVKGVDFGLLWAILPSGLAVAIVGFWDDHQSLPARLRFGVHLAASAWAVWHLGGWPVLDLGVASIAWGAFGSLVATLGLVWMINLYNFMDGIDGLAGSEAVFVSGAGAVLLWLSGADFMPFALLGAASAGFLVLNWPPAKIFMGDAGSGFLGFALGVLGLHSTATGTTSIWPWLILLSVFLVDATLTLLRRAVQGFPVTEAHRTHAYQWAARRVGSHKPVTLCVLLINLFVLLPLAFVVVVQPRMSVIVVTCVLVGLGTLAWKGRAGLPE